MESRDFRGLVEAYSQVYSPAENDENVTEEVTKLPSTINRRRNSSLAKTSSSGRPALGTHDPSKGSYVGKGDIAIGSGRMGTLNPVKSLGRDYKGDKDAVASKYKDQIKSDRKAAAKERSKTGEDRLGKLIRSVQKEELDIFDIVLEFLQVEGYAETLEEAEWMMANVIDEEVIDAILEAEGSYGQTPKAKAAMSKLTIDRMRKPASEYSQRGEKTKKLKAAEKQTRRQDMLSRGLSGGKKSSRPWGPRGKMDADDRAEARAKAVEYGEGGTYGEGGVTKNPKKLRKQKAMGEHD